MKSSSINFAPGGLWRFLPFGEEGKIVTVADVDRLNDLEGDLARSRAMEQAEESLRQDDLAGALDNQSDAMEALREGMRELGEQMAQQQGQPGQQGEGMGQAGDMGRRDPLGRETGQNGRIGTDEQLLQGEDVYRRAEELLDEIRRRSGDQSRTAEERDYLRRLLDQF